MDTTYRQLDAETRLLYSYLFSQLGHDHFHNHFVSAGCHPKIYAQ